MNGGGGVGGGGTERRSDPCPGRADVQRGARQMIRRCGGIVSGLR